jgi:hypothetical protein
LNVYHKRLEAARDKEFAFTQFVNRILIFTNLRMEVNGEYPQMIETLEDGYKLGKPIAQSIAKLRKISRAMNHEGLTNLLKSQGEPSDDSPTLSIETKITRTSNANNLSDEELVKLFAQYKAYMLFASFLEKEAAKFINAESPSIPLTTLLEDIAEKNREFTTARQVLAIHYLLKYCQVKNDDDKEKARFVHFLTGKNLDNIYKKVQSPLGGANKYVAEDLKYVRGHFERLGLKEIVKMISNEIDAGNY